MNRIKQNSAITLIALVITIIVLLILAGLTLTFVLGENGLFGKAKNAKERTEIAQAIEDVKLKILDVQTDAASEGRTATLGDLYNKLEALQDEEYKITTSAQTSRLTNDSDSFGGTITKLYIRNMKYSYIVEVGSNLQIENDVHTVSGTSSTQGENSGGSQTEGGATGGKMFVPLKIDSRTANSITVSVDNKSGLTVSNIEYYKDGEKVYTGNETTYTYINLNKNSSYELSAKAEYTDKKIALTNIKPSSMKQANLIDYWPLNATLTNTVTNGHGDLTAETTVNYIGGGAYLENNGLVANNFTLRRCNKYNCNIPI